MDAFGRINNYWDIAQQPTTFSTLPDDDFLALLQRQFPTSIGGTPKPLELPPDGVDPQSISTFPLPNPSPPSSDSSPSPPSMNDTPISRPASGVFNGPSDGPGPDDPTLKRKASDESMDDEPTSKTPHTNGSNSNHSRKSSASRRKSTGNPQQDEFRLLKRKEQNRAAQRAFRERKEKHVKDLEDKVAALEAKNSATESENVNLRDLLQRLQSENMALKQGNFTFQVNKDGSSGPMFGAQTGPGYPSPAPSGSKSPVAMVPQTPQFNFDFHQLIPFDPNALVEEAPQHTATNGAMGMSFAFGGQMPYRTIASNPDYMSFAEPMNMDLTPTQQSPQPNSHSSPAASIDNMHGLTSFDSWSSPDSLNSLDQLFGGNYMGAQSPVDFTALLNSPPSSISPISHHSVRSNSISTAATSPAAQQSHSESSPAGQSSSSSNQSTPGSTSESSSSPSPAVVTPTTPHDLSHMGECPKTKEDMRNMIQEKGTSPFAAAETPAPVPAGAAFIRKNMDGSRPLIMCEGSSFPKTPQSDKNIEVLTAWRTITSNPQFKDVDINELCSEFTSKARCDGTKVVLEPEGVHRIMEALAAKRQQRSQGQSQTGSPLN